MILEIFWIVSSASILWSWSLMHSFTCSVLLLLNFSTWIWCRLKCWFSMVGIPKLDKTKTSITTILIVYVFCYTYFYDTNNYSEFHKIPKPAKQDAKVWASMGLCYSHNTDLHGKSRYPYKNVAPLALLLWRQRWWWDRRWLKTRRWTLFFLTCSKW